VIEIKPHFDPSKGGIATEQVKQNAETPADADNTRDGNTPVYSNVDSNLHLDPDPNRELVARVQAEMGL